MATKASDIIKKHLLTVDEYHRMGETGILKQQDRVELIEGEIIDIAPIGSNHAGTVNYISKILNTSLQSEAIISSQNPILISDRSEPEPDIVVLRPREDFYRHLHPTPSDIFLVIEVADTSLQYDREIKIPLYAKHNIPAVWLVDLENSQLTSFSSPKNAQYERIEIVTTYFELTIQQVPKIKINLSQLFES